MRREQESTNVSIFEPQPKKKVDALEVERFIEKERKLPRYSPFIV